MRVIKSRIIDLKKDYQELESWWLGHDQRPIPIKLLPSIGYIVPGVCAGFLYQTDSDLTIIEGMISNPDSEPDVRNIALDLVVDSLCFEAEKLGYKAVSAFTQSNKITSRAKKHGFAVCAGTYRLVTRRL